MRTPHPKRSAVAPNAAPVAVADRPPPPPIEPLVLRPKQAAQALQVSERTVWGYIRDGRLTVTRSGGNITWVHLDSLKRLIGLDQVQP